MAQVALEQRNLLVHLALHVLWQTGVVAVGSTREFDRIR
jgi:hypothetical protein